MQIIFNGKNYNSLEEMPANERQAFEQMQQIFVDANGNGIPDFMEGDMFRKVMAATTSNVAYQGQVYSNLDELPSDVREKVQKSLNTLKNLGLVADVPNIQGAPTNAPPSFEPAFQPSKPLLQPEPTIQEVGGNRWMLIIGFLAGLLVCAAAFAVFMVMK